MKNQIIILVLSLFSFLSCNPFYNQYKSLNENIDNGKYSQEKKRVIKYILSKENDKNFLLIISWNKSMLAQEKLTFKALVYNYTTKEKEIYYNSKEDTKNIISSKIIPENKFKSFLYILDKYNNNEEKYLLSLHDSFSSSEVNFPNYLYDFSRNHKLKIRSIFIDENGKLIQ